MRAFADLLETVTPAASTTAARDLTTATSVKTALKITDTASDALIAALITRASALIVDYCRLARDAAGSVPAFGRETLRATWYIEKYGARCRGTDLVLPWRAPVYSVDSVVEDGTTLTVATDYILLGAKGGVLRRLSSDAPIEWSENKIVVTWKAGMSTTSTLAANVDASLEAAAIEQVKTMLFGASRDPSIRSENLADVGAVSYSVPGGDVMGASVLMPSVRDMLAPWRNPAP
jgi:hypothetical protein